MSYKARWSVWREVDGDAEARERAEDESARAASREALRDFLVSVARWLCRRGSVPRDVAALVREGRGWHDQAVALGLAFEYGDDCPSDPDLAAAMDSDPSLHEALVMLYRMVSHRGIRSWSGAVDAFDGDDAERADDLWQAALAGGWDPSGCDAMAAEIDAWRASEAGETES